MSWFRSTSAKPEAPKKDARSAGGAEPQVHRSLALGSLFDEFRRGRKLQVLDLGPATGSNVEFLSQFGCKIYIEDLFAALTARAVSLEDDAPGGRTEEGTEGEEAGAQFFADFLPSPEAVSFDVVLAWDTFNYLTRRELGAFLQQLAPLCHSGTVVFAMISILKQMSAAPIRFRIVDEQSLAYELRTQDERPAPRYHPADLNELLRGFRVDRSFLLRHGVQEYLFVKE